MQWGYALFAAMFGAVVGGLIAVVIVFACSATVGIRDLDTALNLAVGTVLADAIIGAVVTVIIWWRSGKPPTV